MRILLIATAYNSLTQRAHVELTNLGHDVSIELAINDLVITEAVALYQPDLIIAPMLKTAIPEQIWRNNLCIIIHPGIKGDRGPSSLDWAIVNEEEEWGVTALQAEAEMDAGPIWSSFNFKMPPQPKKSSLYRHQVSEAAMLAILQTVERFASGVFVPEALDYSKPDVKGCLRPLMKQEVRAVNWFEPTSCILKKIRAADSCPGVLDTIYGEQYYLYGAHEEDILKGTPGKIIAQRHGAICRATGDGAIWISHLKKKNTAEQSFFKLPAAMVLGEHLKNVPEDRMLHIPDGCKTYKEIWYEENNDVGYLHFEFYNGAMSTEQCQGLREAFIFARTRPTKAIVLMGGSDFWSNGIHLNTIEAAENPADESWRNINAMNDLIYEIITTDTHLTIAAMQGNAGAGGVMLALAADRVYARTGVILNPHYKGMGILYGSEYWTYLLPKRVGDAKAIELNNSCLPVGTQEAKQIKLIDNDFGDCLLSFRQFVVAVAEAIAHSPDYQQRLDRKNKIRQQDEQIEPLAAYRAKELERIKDNFYGSDPSYHIARSNFVYKVKPSKTPLHLAKHRNLVINEYQREA